MWSGTVAIFPFKRRALVGQLAYLLTHPTPVDEFLSVGVYRGFGVLI